MCKILACDLDGTLFYPRRFTRCIPKKNVKFLRRWIDAGNRVVFISSRSTEFISKLQKEVQRPFDFLPCSTALMYHDGEIIKDTPMNNKELSDIFWKIDEKYQPRGVLLTSEGHPCVIYNPKRVGFFFKLFYQFWYWFQFKYREPKEQSNELFLKELESGKVYKVMTFFGFGKKKGVLSKEINKALRENYPEIESSWSLIVNELTPKGCSKGEGLEEYCRRLNINKDDVYVVGDSGNDITMFQKFHEHSYCMAHAYPSVKKYAKETITYVYKLDKLVLKGEK